MQFANVRIARAGPNCDRSIHFSRTANAVSRLWMTASGIFRQLNRKELKVCFLIAIDATRSGRRNCAAPAELDTTQRIAKGEPPQMTTQSNEVPDDDRRVRGLMDAAKQAAASGRLQESMRLLQQAEREAPRHPLVLKEAAIRMLQSGDAAEALALLERVTRELPSDPLVWFSIAGAWRKLGRIGEALEAIDRALKLEPRNLNVLLEKASLQELDCKPRAAAASYRMALQQIPAGFQVPPQLRASLQHAMEAVDANNRVLEAYLDEGLAALRAEFAGASLGRFEQCVATMLQKRRIFRQQPSFMCFPELPAIEFYERCDFPWLDALEAATDDIRAELLAVLADGGEDILDPYVADQQELDMSRWRELNRSRRWGVYSLWREGIAFPDHIARCPKTVAALGHWPRWDMPGSGPTALFSVLDAKTRIPAHTGPVNTRLVVHLPLIVPPGCLFRVGGQCRERVPGKAFVFDDSINHEAWNDSDAPRAVLIVDIWSPFLSEAERALTRALTARIGEYYGSMSNSGAAG
jgi:aspartate beta-hydroxylase